MPSAAKPLQEEGSRGVRGETLGCLSSADESRTYSRLKPEIPRSSPAPLPLSGLAGGRRRDQRRALATAIVLALATLMPLGAAAQPSTLSALEDEISAPAPRPRQAGQSELDRALAAKDYARAGRLLAEAIERKPDSRALLLQIASVFQMDRKPLNAAIALKKAEQLAPLDRHERLQLALAYIGMGRRDWARPELDRLATDDPDDFLPRYWLARLDYDDGRYASAVDRLQQVVKLAPGFVRAHDNLGLSYEALHEPDEALRHYQEAVRLNRMHEADSSAWPPLNLGILLRTRGKPDEAEALFRESLRYEPGFAPGHYQLGAVLEERGRLEEAVRSLETAAAADVSYPDPHYALARIYRRLGHISQADTALATFKRLHASREESRR